MCRIAITGDCHGERSAVEVWKREWKKKYFSTLIIAGDAGYVWNPFDLKEQKTIKAIDECPFDVLVASGNHENYDVIHKAPLEDYCEGKAYRISEKLRYAEHGHFFRINDHPILIFGGAESVDKEGRIEGKSWWSQEIPSYADCNRAAENIGKYCYYLGFKEEPLNIITHTAPDDIVETLKLSNYDYGRINDPVAKQLTHMRSLLSTTQQIQWFFGHFHKDGVIRKLNNITYYGLYHRIVYIGKE